jgi:pimeloyl-ACP methyl ester carboxylesterase
VKKGYVDLPLGQLHYRTAGSGEPVLLLHQAPMSSEEYVGMLPLLAPHCRAIALDFPGHGDSDNPPREFEIEDYARVTVDFMDAMKIQQATIVGHHTGAVVAVEMAVAYPQRVSRLVLSGCPVLDAETWQEHLSRPGFRNRPLDAEGELVKHVWGVYRSLSGHPDPQQWLGPFLLGMKSRSAPYDAHHAVARYPIKARLGLIKCPTLLLSGSRDMFYGDLESTRRLIPGATAGVVEDGGVFVAREQPERFAAAIVQFLKGRTSAQT